MSILKPSPKLKLAISFALVALVFAVFWPTLSYPFIIFDDPDYVSQNPVVQQGLTWTGIQWAFTAAFSSNWHPITWMSHMLDCQLFGLNAGFHHLTNLVWHALNSILVFLLLNRMFGTVWRSAFVAAVFAVHPLHIESVAWIAERKDLLSTFFFLISVETYLTYAESRKSGHAKATSWGSYAAAVLLFALGLMAKPMIVTLPFVLLLLDFWPLKRMAFIADNERPASVTRPQQLLPLIAEKIPFFVLTAVSCSLTIWAQGSGHSIQSSAGFPIWFRISNAFCSYLDYLAKTVWPTHLAIFYPHPGSAPVLKLLIAVALVLGVTMLSWRWRSTRPWLLVGWLWFVGTLVPVIGLVQVGDQAMADRYTYIPLLGVFLLVTWEIAERLKGDPKNKAIPTSNATNQKPVILACTVVLSAFALVSILQVRYWKNTETLFKHAASVTKNNYVAQTILGTLLASQGHVDQAIELYSNALKAKPNYPEAAVALGLAYNTKGEQTKAIEMFSQALKSNPYAPDANKFYGMFLANKQQWSEAEVCLRLALQYLPGDLDVLSNLGTVLHSQGKIQDAITYYQRASALSPASFSLHQSLGNALIAQGRFAEAVAEFRAVLRLKPDSIEALNRLAWVLATHQDQQLRNGSEAVALATKACQLSGQNQPLPLISLAAALAETGQFAEAVSTAQKALKLARSANQAGVATVISKLIELFQSSKPYREASAQ